MEEERARSSSFSLSFQQPRPAILNPSSPQVSRNPFAASLSIPAPVHVSKGPDLHEAITKAITTEEKPPKEKHVRTIVASTWRSRTAQPFWEAARHSKDIGINAVATWKTLVIAYGLLRDGFPMIIHETWLLFREDIVGMSNTVSRSLHTYSKIAGQLGQLLLFKVDFHHRFPTFSATFEDDISLTSFSLADQRTLLSEFLQLQQLLIMLSATIFSTARSLPVSMSEAARKDSFACIATPMAGLAREMFFVYLRSYELIYNLAIKDQATNMNVQKKRFDDLYVKMDQIFFDVRITEALHGLVDLPMLPPTPPEISVTPPARLPRPPSQAFGGMRLASDDHEHAEGDPREGLLPKLRQDHDQLLQQVEDDKGIIASLEHYISEIYRALCHSNGAGGTVSPMQQAEEVKKAVLEQAQSLALWESRSEELKHAATTLAQTEKQLQAANESLASSQATIESLSLLAEDSRATIEQLQAQLENTERSLATAEHGQVSAWEAQAAISEELDQSRATLAATTARCDSQTMECESLKAKLQSMDKELDQVKAAHSNCAAQIATQEVSLQRERDAAKRMAEKAAEMATQCKALQAALSEANERATSSLQETLGALSAAAADRESAQKLQAECESLRTQMAAMREESDKARREVAAAEEAQRARIAQLQADLEASNRRLVAAIEADAQAEESARTLTQQLESARGVAKDLEAAQAKISQLGEQLQTANATMAVAQTSLQTEQASTAHLKSELRETTSQLEQLRLATDQERSKTSGALAALEEELKHVRATGESAQQEAASLADALSTAKRAEAESAAAVLALRAEQTATKQACQASLQKAEQDTVQRVSQGNKALIKTALDQANTTAGQLKNVVPKVYWSPTIDELSESATTCDSLLKAFSSGLTAFLQDGSISTDALVAPVRLADLARRLGEGIVSMAVQENFPNENCVTAAQQLAEKLKCLYSTAASALNDSSVDVRATFAECAVGLDAARKQVSGLADRLADQAAQGDVLDNEMHDTNSAVDDATRRIEAMIEKAKADMAEGKLAVDPAILEMSIELIRRIKELLKHSSDTQHDIVRSETVNKGQTPTQFYRRHTRWVEGLLSAAKAVGAGAAVLVDCADVVMHGGGHFEELLAASHEIAASSAQLVYASRAKAPASSKSSQLLESTSKKVAEAVRALIDVTRDRGLASQESMNAEDYLKLSVTQAKRLEMDAQVRLLSLEAAITRERERLGQLRRARYQNSGAEQSQA